MKPILSPYNVVPPRKRKVVLVYTAGYTEGMNRLLPVQILDLSPLSLAHRNGMGSGAAQRAVSALPPVLMI